MESTTGIRPPEDVATYYFWQKYETFISTKPEVELISSTVHMENIFNVKYI